MLVAGCNLTKSQMNDCPASCDEVDDHLPDPPTLNPNPTRRPLPEPNTRNTNPKK